MQSISRLEFGPKNSTLLLKYLVCLVFADFTIASQCNSRNLQIGIIIYLGKHKMLKIFENLNCCNIYLSTTYSEMICDCHESIK